VSELRVNCERKNCTPLQKRLFCAFGATLHPFFTAQSFTLIFDRYATYENSIYALQGKRTNGASPTLTVKVAFGLEFHVESHVESHVEYDVKSKRLRLGAKI
jgi:hypothetical protein